MCGIAGFSNFSVDYTDAQEKWKQILNQMAKVQHHRGPDDEGRFLDRHCGLAHVRLSIIDLAGGHQPMTRVREGRSMTIVYNGEIYNMRELREELEDQGIRFETTSDTEVILAGYEVYGTEVVQKLNGIFAFAIWDSWRQSLYLFRDHSGIKPLFYTRQGQTLVFASELKGLFEFPEVRPELDREGLCEVFGLGPAKTYGKGVFAGVKEVRPGHFLEVRASGQREICYWRLESRPHEESYEETVEHTRELVTSSIRRQMLSDVEICTFLSGGVDSSLVTAVCSQELKKQGKRLTTYSFDFKDNNVNFKSNAFQPSQDRPWVERMVEFAGTDHHFLECDREELYEELFWAVDARDLPCMADVESSMLYFCRQVAARNKVTLTGECADEIFGGYPWFHKKECFEAHAFPWSMDMAPRTMLLKDEVLRELPLEEYAREAYEKTISETPVLPGETEEESRRREISYLNLKWFMQTLLDRMDRTSMYSGLEARVPFADHRIIEYVWNVPWSMKCHGGIVKGLLRAAGEPFLPRDVLYRRKSPYPKTYDPAYEELVKQNMRLLLEEKDAPLNRLIDREKVLQYMDNPLDYGRPFYGQLMAGPQLLAYLLQVNYWMQKWGL